MRIKHIFSSFLIIFAVACASSPLGRKQLILLPDRQMSTLGIQAFDQMKAEKPIDRNPALNAYLKCITDPLLGAAKDELSESKWEIVIFQDDTANAFALPGGKIGVHTGILPVAKTDAQLAAVIGHEIGHVIARHGNERVSEAFAAQGGLTAIGAITASNPNNNKLMALLGLGTQVGLLLPHSRTQESEADLIGLDLMSRSGFDPKQSIELWKNMMTSSEGAPPEFLSTHPAGKTRIRELESNMPDSLKKYEAAQEKGHRPICTRP